MNPAAVTSKWLEGRVAAQHRWTERLFSLRVEADIPFEAGQFAKLALEVEGEMLARPYSFVNPPEERPNEFYYVKLPEGPLTRNLCKLETGDRIWLAPRPAGFLALSEVPEGENLWLISTGTGIGPFLSILRTEAPWRRFRQVVLVHAVRQAEELTHREIVAGLMRRRGGQMRAISFVSRETAPGALPGRIPAAIEEGRLEAAAGVTLSAEKSQVMICGNPDMVKDTSAVLAKRGMKKHRRRDPGHITVENYW